MPSAVFLYDLEWADNLGGLPMTVPERWWLGYSSATLCYGKIAVEIAAASLSKGHSTAAVRYGVNKAIEDLGCADKSDSMICIFLNDALEILQL